MSKFPAGSFLLLFALPTFAAPPSGVLPSTAVAKPAAVPFSYQTGVTTEADAKKPDPRRKGEMFSVFGVDVDSASAASFYFYDGILFRIEVPLKAALPFSIMAPTAST